MDFRVLGPLEVSRGGAPVPIGSTMQRRLLTLLLLHAGEVVRADRVIDVLWGEQPPPSARRGLHSYMSRLRGALETGAQIESEGHGYRLRLGQHQLDANTFEQMVVSAGEHQEDAPERTAADLTEALGLWRGPAYADFADEDFARPEAVRLEELRLAANEHCFAARLACGDPGVIADLEAFVIVNDLRERPHIQLMTALSRSGRRREALEIFDQVRRRTAHELGLDPSPELRQVQADILQQGLSTTPEVPEHHERSRIGTAGNLPLPVSSLRGRQHETEAVGRLLARDRLVTLTGVGGAGKTRLAMEAAESSRSRCPDGVWWCELAPVDAAAVDHVVATVLGVQQQADHTIIESIVGALAGKRLLLILDNCEHVLQASGYLAERILRRCGEVTILATSRQPLAVDGEQVWVVPPLPLPADRTNGSEAPSTQLFFDRARAHRVGFTAEGTRGAAVADICRQLDGLPLAIELAAALVPALDPAEIADRLGHRFRLLTHGQRGESRHRSLAAVVQWSYQLLDPDQQRLFDRLAVFTGGFSLRAAEDICSDEALKPEHIAAMLAGLVTRSMVGVDPTVTPPRYRLLETLRHFAQQRLAERGEESALRARHASWFVGLAEVADPDVRGPGEAEAVAMLEVESANLRAAHRFAIIHDDADLALRLSASLYAFALHRLHDEVFAWAEQAAELRSAAEHPLRPTVWGMAANGISNRGDLVRARTLAEGAVESAGEGAAQSAATDLYPAQHTLGATALYEGRLDDCRRHAHESVASGGAAEGSYYPVLAGVHEVLALIYGGREDAGAVALALRRAADTLGNPTLQAWSRFSQAEACGDEDPEHALELLEETLALTESVHGRFVEGVARHAVASLRARHHGPREAMSSFRNVIDHWRRAGDWTHQWTTLRNLIPLLVTIDADRPAALLYGAQRQSATAAPVYGADAERLAETSQTLAGRLGTDAFEELVAQGGRFSDHDAVDVALATITEVRSESSPGAR